jgi:pyruvate dehydrogenase E2 component (dihydrolipoamide acetyltransferase)
MSEGIYLPKWGMTMTEALVVNWLKSTGDELKEGEDLVVVETDKVTNTLSAPISGKLTEILVNEGEYAEVGAKLGIISTSEKEESC